MSWWEIGILFIYLGLVLIVFFFYVRVFMYARLTLNSLWVENTLELLALLLLPHGCWVYNYAPTSHWTQSVLLVKQDWAQRFLLKRGRKDCRSQKCEAHHRKTHVKKLIWSLELTVSEPREPEWDDLSPTAGSTCGGLKSGSRSCP